VSEEALERLIMGANFIKSVQKSQLFAVAGKTGTTIANYNPTIARASSHAAIHALYGQYIVRWGVN